MSFFFPELIDRWRQEGVIKIIINADRSESNHTEKEKKDSFSSLRFTTIDVQETVVNASTLFYFVYRSLLMWWYLAVRCLDGYFVDRAHGILVSEEENNTQ